MIQIKIHSESYRLPVHDLQLRKVARKTLLSLKAKDLSGVINVVVAGRSQVRRYNRQFRGVDQETDVVAFRFYDLGRTGKRRGIQAALIGKTLDRSAPFGDVFISWPNARENACRFHVTAREEIQRLVIHGVLHVFGYRDDTKLHRKIMWAKQESILSSVIKKPSNRALSRQTRKKSR